MSEHRTKTYLWRCLKVVLHTLTPSMLGLSDDFMVQCRGEGNNWLQIAIKDPNEALPRWYEIRLIEKK